MMRHSVGPAQRKKRGDDGGGVGHPGFAEHLTDEIIERTEGQIEEDGAVDNRADDSRSENGERAFLMPKGGINEQVGGFRKQNAVPEASARAAGAMNTERAAPARMARNTTR